MRTGDLVRAAFVAALLTGCSDPHAGTLPTTSPTVTTVAPTQTALTDLRTSLTAAVHTYFDALYAAGMDPAHRTDALARLIAPSCPCTKTLDVLREEARLGRYLDYRYTVRDVTVVSVGDLGGDVKYTVAQSAGAERDRRSGRVIERFAPVTKKFSAHFRRADGQWLLSQVVVFEG